MRVAIIGRTKMLYDCIELLLANGCEIPLIITSRAAPEYEIKESDFENKAKNIGAEFILTQKINHPDIIDKLKELPPIDIAVSINYSGVIADGVINLFKHGILNAHGGDLPRYRGNACQAWAIINGETSIGLTIHKMIANELDSGDIIFKKIYPINENTRVGQVYEWFEKDIPQMMFEALKLINDEPSRNFQKQSTDPDKILRCYPRSPEDGCIKWDRPAIEILRLINASSEPYPGAFCYYKGSKMLIWRATIITSTEKYLAVPGQVESIDKESGSITIITGNGFLKISEVQLEGLRCKPSQIIKSVRERLN